MSRTSEKDRRIVELEAGTLQIVSVYRGVTETSRLRGVSRAALYDALNSGKTCLGSRWMFGMDWDVRAAAFHGLSVDQFMEQHPTHCHL